MPLALKSFSAMVSEEIITEFGAVAAEGLRLAHFGRSLFHCLDNGGNKGKGYVSDAETEHFTVGICLFKFVDTAGNFRKKIAAAKL